MASVPCKQAPQERVEETATRLRLDKNSMMGVSPAVSLQRLTDGDPEALALFRQRMQKQGFAVVELSQASLAVLLWDAQSDNIHGVKL